MQIFLRTVKKMIFRGTKLLLLLGAAAAAMSFPSCSAEVGQFEVHHNTDLSKSVTTAAASETTTTTTTTALVYRGNIYDTNLNLVTYGTYAKGEYDERLYGENCAYSFSNIISEASGGFDSSLSELLKKANPTHINADHDVGSSVRLTIDSDVQTALSSYMANMGMSGSIVVLRTDGSILAEVSYPTYDPELYYSDAELSKTRHSPMPHRVRASR